MRREKVDVCVRKIRVTGWIVRESGRSSTPRLLSEISPSLDYWIARSRSWLFEMFNPNMTARQRD